MNATIEIIGTIRRANTSEAQSLSALAFRSKAYWGYSPEFMAACRIELTFSAEQIDSPRMHFMVLEHDDCIVGFYALSMLSENDIELEALFVEPDCIGRGFGRRLIEHAKQFAMGLSAKRMTIQGDPNAKSFYIAAGGELTGERESLSIPGRLLPTFAIPLVKA